ncbi:MAG: polysaccharide pyruvyl transferase family protein [Waterburya sp.]
MSLISLNLYQRVAAKLGHIFLRLQHDCSFTIALWSAKIHYGWHFFGRQQDQDDLRWRKYLLLDVSSEGSLGDEAMIMGAMDFLSGQGVKTVAILSAHNRQNWQGYDLTNIALEISFFSLDFSSNDGGSYHQFNQIAQQYTHFLVPGADVMDGYYSEASPLLKLRLISLAQGAGLDCSLGGFSFNHQPKQSCLQALQKLPKNVKLHARDPQSKVRFEQHLHRPINLVADLAFLLSPRIEPSVINPEQSWINQERMKGNLIIGINPNKTLASQLQTDNPTELATVFADLIQGLHQRIKNISFVLIPHDYRSDQKFPGDDILSELIQQQLPLALQSSCYPLTKSRLRAAEVQNICQCLDFVVTSRMHLAIACLRVQTPVQGIVYQGKFEGLYSYFGLEHLLIEPTEAMQPDKLLSFVTSGIENREQIKQQIAQKLPQVIALAQQNFA